MMCMEGQKRESEQIKCGLLCGLHCPESVLHLGHGDVSEHIHDGATPKMLLTSELCFIHPLLQVMHERVLKNYFQHSFVFRCCT